MAVVLLAVVGVIGLALSAWAIGKHYGWTGVKTWSDAAPVPSGDAPAAVPAPAAEDPMLLLVDAIKRGDTGQVRSHITGLAVADLNRVFGGMTPLMTAASHGDVAVVSLLLDHGADPNQRGRSRRTALQYAAEKDRLAVARALLDAGADINGYDKSRLTPLTMAADRNFTALATLLIERGADVNIAHVKGWTPLIDAARNGNLELVRLLLRHGADPAYKMPDGNTASTIAARYGHSTVSGLLQQ